jgi:hypothetical protein
MHIRVAQSLSGTTIPWLCDTMTNDAKHAMGNSPNSEFVIDPKGRVVRRRSCSSPQELRWDLGQLVGPVKNPTQVADLDLNVEPLPETVASGVVPRVVPPLGDMTAQRVVPQKSPEPFYAKLRVESSDLLRGSGDGALCLGFHLDPMYEVHWNNLAEPLFFKIKTPPGVAADPLEGQAPQVTVPADIDPREFLIHVTGRSEQPLQLEVQYFVCSDKEGWCKLIQQEYLVYLEKDRDGGSTLRRGQDGVLRPNAPFADAPRTPNFVPLALGAHFLRQGS